MPWIFYARTPLEYQAITRSRCQTSTVCGFSILNMIAARSVSTIVVYDSFEILNV